VSRNEIEVVCDTAEYDSEFMLQIITKARSLADDCDWEVTVICIGEYDEPRFQMLRRYGANNVIICEYNAVQDIQGWTDIVTSIMKKRCPGLVLFPASIFGKAMAAILSTRFEVGLTADCIDIELNYDGDFSFYRAAISDSVVAEIRCKDCDIRLCTVKKDVFIKCSYKGVQKYGVEKFDYAPNIIKSNFLEVVEFLQYREPSEVDISKYEVVFCIGRGVRHRVTRDKIFSLAERCGAGVVGTRAVVEEGMVEKGCQVGQSGKSISPKIYVGFGVSGASQHMVGITNSDIIIAINTDENAAIFNYSNYSIICDVDEVLNEMDRLLLI